MWLSKLHQVVDSDMVTIPGWCSLEKAHYLVDMVVAQHIRSFVELGVYGGRSLMPVALAIKMVTAGEPTEGIWVVGVDQWSQTASLEGATDAPGQVENSTWWSKINYEQIYQGAVEMLKKYNLERLVGLHRVASQDFHPSVARRSIDMLHLDGNHTELVSRRDVALYHDKVKLGGWWVFDDTDWESTKMAQADLEELGYTCVKDAVTWKVYQRTKLID